MRTFQVTQCDHSTEDQSRRPGIPRPVVQPPGFILRFQHRILCALRQGLTQGCRNSRTHAAQKAREIMLCVRNVPSWNLPSECTAWCREPSHFNFGRAWERPGPRTTCDEGYPVWTPTLYIEKSRAPRPGPHPMQPQVSLLRHQDHTSTTTGCLPQVHVHAFLKMKGLGLDTGANVKSVWRERVTREADVSCIRKNEAAVCPLRSFVAFG